MAEVTTKQLLDDARTALDNVFKRGQSYTIDGRSFTAANVKDLQAIVQSLEIKYNAEQGNRPVMQIFNLSGMG